LHDAIKCQEAIDSIVAVAVNSNDIPIPSLEQGTYCLYTAGLSGNKSIPAGFVKTSVGIEDNS
jgi:hypothetical protein